MSKELLFSVTKKDFDVQTFRGSGPGGQHRNKTDSAVRIIHRESGAVGESQTEKSQHTNKRLALQRLVASPRFKSWLARKHKDTVTGKTAEERVEESMRPENLRVEFYGDDGWQEEVTADREYKKVT